jgi:hypothetical protein
MDAKLIQLSRMLKRYDSDLFPKRSMDGALGIYRKKKRYQFFDFQGSVLLYSQEFNELVLPVTDTWQENGVPVDWGIEPIFWQIQKTDAWRGGEYTDYQRFCEERENRKRNRDRAFRNEVRAIAADTRREFAQATNEINTSSLDKIDSRRRKDAYCR